MSDEFEDRVRSWLRERGRTERGLLASVAGHVAVLPPRRPDRRRPLVVIAATLLLAVVALYALLPRVGQVGSPDALSDSPQPTLVRYAGDGFTFDYPATWQVISGFEHAGLHGPTVAAAVGTGSFDLGCVTTPPSGGDLGGVGCPAEPRWDVPDDGVVVAYWARAHLGTPWQTALPTLAAGEHWQQVGGRPAAAFDDPESPTWRWRLAVEPWVIEARFGPAASEATRAAVRALIESWQWQDASPTVTPQPTPEPTPDDIPIWATNLVGALDCDGPPQDVGAEIGGMKPEGSTGTASPYPWLEQLDDADLPLTRWVEDPNVPWEYGRADVMRYVYVVDGRTKGAIVMRGHSTNGGYGRWAVVGFRACAPDEFDPHHGRTTDDAPWRDAQGNVSERVRSLTGPAHCGWESTIWLRVDGRLYLRDPLGLFAAITVGPYLPTIELPRDAVASGLESAGRELFESPDKDFVWVRTADGVERWPKATDEPRCA